MKENERVMSEVVEYLDTLVTTINSRLSEPIPEQHSCQKPSDELCNNQLDYINLINKLQRHTRCSSAYCLRVKDEQQYSRFDYPKDNVEHTIVQDNGHGQPE